MAKTIGALISLKAKGTIAKTLTFQSRGFRPAVNLYNFPGSRKHFKPSGNQLAQRRIIAAKVLAWQKLTAPERFFWESEAVKQKYIGTGYHLFISRYHFSVSLFAFILAENGNNLTTEENRPIILE